MFVHCTSPEGDVVPGTDLLIHHTATTGDHSGIVAISSVFCFKLLDTIDVDPDVIIPAVYCGLQAEGHPPSSRYGRSEDS